jgi:hypothetical protein
MLQKVTKLRPRPLPPRRSPAVDCPVCGHEVRPHEASVVVHGVRFHSACAGYKRRAAV